VPSPFKASGLVRSGTRIEPAGPQCVYSGLGEKGRMEFRVAILPGLPSKYDSQKVNQRER